MENRVPVSMIEKKLLVMYFTSLSLFLNKCINFHPTRTLNYYGSMITTFLTERREEKKISEIGENLRSTPNF